MLFLALLDLVCKILARKEGLPKIKNTFFEISYFANPGIAFSIPLPKLFILIITGTLIAIFAVSYHITKERKIKIALAAALLGATSNFLDRVLTGYTTDYIILFSQSAINIADILIIAGIGYCAWYYQHAD